MAAWVFSGVLVGFMALLLISLTLAAHCINPARRHNSLRTLRLQANRLSRCFCRGALQLAVPDPVEDPWYRNRERLSAGVRGAAGGTGGISPALLALLPTRMLPGDISGRAGDQLERKGSGSVRDAGACRSGEECAICQEEFGGGQTLATLPCGHEYHQQCVSKWLLRKARCPMCQQEVTEEAVKGLCSNSPSGNVVVSIELAAGPPPAALARAQSV